MSTLAAKIPPDGIGPNRIFPTGTPLIQTTQQTGMVRGIALSGITAPAEPAGKNRIFPQIDQTRKVPTADTGEETRVAHPNEETVP